MKGVGMRHRARWMVLGVLVLLGLLTVAASCGGGGMGRWDGWSRDGWDWTGHGGMMADHMGRSYARGEAPAPVPGGVDVRVTASEMRFDPATITATAGTPLNLTLVNDGRLLHDLTVPDLGFVLVAEPGERASGGVTPEEPGTYELLCSVPGHAGAGMRGTLVVQPAGGR